MDYACDAEPDCLDNSDEIGCDQIEFEKSYDKSVPRHTTGNKKDIFCHENFDVLIFYFNFSKIN